MLGFFLEFCLHAFITVEVKKLLGFGLEWCCNCTWENVLQPTIYMQTHFVVMCFTSPQSLYVEF